MSHHYCRYLLLLLACFLWAKTPVLAQKNKSNTPTFQCNVPELTPEQRRALESEAAFALQVKRASGNKANGITYVPIRPHILRSSAGTGGLTLTRLNYLLARTNRYYLLNGNGIQFFFCGTAPDYIDNDAYYSTYSSSNEGAMANSRDAANAMNMYFINNTNEGFAGYAYYPDNARYSTRSVILSSLSDDRLGDRTIPHELGHNFNLIHTHGDSNQGNELVTRGAGANCAVAGDLLCDTPADPYGRTGFSTGTDPNGCLFYNGTVTDANGATYNPPVNNLMSYYDPCRYEFTPGQYARIDEGLALRQSHTAYSLTCAPTAVNAPSNLIATNGLSGVVLTWTDNATNEMGYFVERATSSTGPFMPIGGVAPNVNTYTDPAPPGNTLVYYRIRPSNSTTGGISAAASVVTPACRPVFTTGCTDNDGLNGFVFNAVTLSQNTSCASGATGYSQYTATTATVTPGTSYSFSGTLLSASFPEGVAIWADLNRNGQFGDAGEQLFITPSLVTGSFSGNLTIPNSVTAGALPLRVTVVYNTTAIEPCGSYQYGETEDYSLNVVVPSGCDPLEPNDTYQTATLLTDGANYVSPPLCLSSGTDQDWFRWRTAGGTQTFYIKVRPYSTSSSGPYQFSLTIAGDVLTVWTKATNSGQTTDTYLELYGSDGVSLLAQNDDYNGTVFSRVVYSPSGSQPCDPPTGLYSYGVNTSGASVSWSYSPSLQYNLRYRLLNTSTWNTVNGLTSINYSVTGLTNNTTYEWQVQSVCSGTNVSAFTTSSTFITGCFAPAYQYADYRTSTSAALYWEYKGDGVQYELNYRIVGAATWTSVNSLTTNVYTLTGLVNGTTYEFRVRTLCGAGGSSAFSTPSTFQTSCNAPQYVSGYGYGNSGTQAYVSWAGVTDGQTRYEVRYRPVGTTSFVTLPSAVTSIGTTLTGLTPNTVYEFQVRTLCSDAQSSTFTALASFTTTGCQPPYSLYVDNVNVQGARLNWYSSESGMTYYPRYRAVGTTSWIYPFPLSTTATSYSLGGITPGTTYEWEVYTQCSGFVSSSYAIGNTFTTLDCPAPASLAVSSIGSTSVTLGWTVTQANVPMIVQWRTAGSTTWNSVTTTAGATNYILTGLTQQTTYEWQLKTYCSASSSSNFVAGSNFTTTDLICRPTFSNGCNGGDALIAFSLNDDLLSQNTGCSAGAYGSFTSLNTYIAPGATVPVSGTFSDTYGEGVTIWVDLNRNNVFEPSEKLYQTTSTVTRNFAGNITIPAGTSNGTVRLRVLIVYSTAIPNDPCGSYQYGEAEDYLVTVGTPTGYNPRTQSITRNSAQLRWNLLTTGLSYEVQWRPVGSSTWTTANVGTGTTYSLTGLAPNTVYEWQMRPTGTTTWNGPVNFTTVGCNAPVTSSVSVSPTTAYLNWSAGSANPSGTLFDLQYKPTSSGTWTSIVGLTSGGYSLTGLSSNTPYQWQVRSVCSVGESSSYTPGASFTTASCSAPLSLCISTGFGSAFVDWASSFSGLTFEVQWRVQGASAWNSVTVTDSQYNLTGLNVNTTYEVQVRTICSPTESSAFSTVRTFTTQCATPSGLYTTNINSYAAQLEWNGSGALYSVSWRQANAPSWTTVPELISTNNYVLTNLTNATAYEWRVEAVCPTPSTTATSGTAAPVSFTTVCPTPSSVYSSTLTGGLPYLYWSSQRGVSYQVQWWPRSNPGAVVSSPILNEGTSSYTIVGVGANTTYDIRLQSICANGITSGYVSTSFVSTTISSCVAQSANYTTASPSAFQADLYASVNGSSQVAMRWRAVGQTTWIMALTQSSTYQTARGLQPGTVYEWQAGGYCPGQPPVYGAVQTFTTSAGSGTACNFSSGVSLYCIGSTAATLVWTGQTGTTYDIQYSVNGGSFSLVSGISSNVYVLSGLPTGSQVTYQLRGVCSNGISSSFSSPASFTTSCRAPFGLYTYTPYDNTCGAMGISWQNGCISSLDEFELQYRQQGTSAWTSIPPLTSSSTSLTGLTPGVGYDYRIRTLCGGGSSTSFTVGSFTVGACQCNAPPVYNLSAYDITTNAATLQWITASGSNSYEVRWKPGNATTWSTTTVSGNSVRITGLTNNAPYDWQVRTICTAGYTSSYSPSSYFRTVCNSPTSLVASNITSSSALLSWNGYGTGVSYEVQYRPQGNPAWQSITNISSETQAVTNLTNGATYEAQVATRCADGSVTDYSPPVTFRAACPEPTYMNVSSTNPNTALLVWRGAAGAAYELQWRPVGSSVWNIVNFAPVNTTQSTFFLTGLTGGTAYEWQVRTNCGGGFFSNSSLQPLTFVTPPGGPPCVNGIITVKDGNWNDPTVWSCGVVPTANDPVTVNHAVTVPPGITGNALRISYGAGARISFGTGARIRLGP